MYQLSYQPEAECFAGVRAWEVFLPALRDLEGAGSGQNAVRTTLPPKELSKGVRAE